MTTLSMSSAARVVIALGLGMLAGCSSTPTIARPELTFRRPPATATVAETPAAAPVSTPSATAQGQIATTAPAPAAAPPNTTEPPAVAGSRLHSTEAETATQRALELTRKLSEADAERTRLTARIERLEAAGLAKDHELEQARMDIQSARAEMGRARDELERWKQEIATLRDKLRGADEENLHTLQTAVSLLQQILSQADEHDAGGASGRAE